MPKALEAKLAREAATKNLRGKAAKAYIYGTMRNIQSGPKFSKAQIAEDKNGGNADGE